MKNSLFPSHWTPSYVSARVRSEAIYMCRPNLPWLNLGAISFLKQWLSSDDNVFEWGSGRSTIWFAQKVKCIHSVEHDSNYFDRLCEIVKDMRLGNIIPISQPLHTHMTQTSGHISNKKYEMSIADFPENHFDLVVIDGRRRRLCLELSISHVKPGGIICLDNSERYLETHRAGIHPIVSFAEPLKDALINNFRSAHFSNGVWSTSLLFRVS